MQLLPNPSLVRIAIFMSVPKLGQSRTVIVRGNCVKQMRERPAERVTNPMGRIQQRRCARGITGLTRARGVSTY